VGACGYGIKGTKGCGCGGADRTYSVAGHSGDRKRRSVRGRFARCTVPQLSVMSNLQLAPRHVESVQITSAYSLS